jgi:D-alanyl-D-alanine carboxypeptidase/D-alanyl-D-alanine-endopeptidase (penicillin-binding protein 4)
VPLPPSFARADFLRVFVAVPHRARRAFVLVLVGFALSSTTGGAEQAPRAVPTAASSRRVVEALAALERWVTEHGGRLGAALMDVRSGSLIAQASAGVPLNPASNQKLCTSAAALALLGAEHRFTTELLGTLNGSRVDTLVLRGDGDPALDVQDLARLARALAARGVSEVGDILVDQSAFEDAFVPPAFEQQPNEWAAFRAPVSAVALSRNAVTVHVLPTEPGQPARVWVEPPGAATVSGRVMTDQGTRRAVGLTMSAKGPLLTARVGGSVGASSGRVSLLRRMGDPRLAPGNALARLLGEAGVRMTGSVGLGGSAEKRRITYIESPPLGVLLGELGKASDNFSAEMLLRALDPGRASHPAESARGAAAVAAFLRSVAAWDPGSRVVNGSGLFDANRISARGLAALLREAYRRAGLMPEFVAQLSIGGVDGTLRHRFGRLAACRCVRAKTGTLDGVVALSGYVFPVGYPAPFTFSLLVTDLPGRHAETRRRIDRVVEVLAGLP